MSIQQDYFNHILNDVKVELTEEFDQNFTRKAFFDQPWPQTKWDHNLGSLMLRTGTLRNSISSTIEGENIAWRSFLPYANIHNTGGEIEVTAKMKSFFWAMFYQCQKAMGINENTKQPRNTIRNKKLSNEAAIWKSLALLKTGYKIKMPKRQFIGNHPQVGVSVERVTTHWFTIMQTDLANEIKPT